MVFQRVSDYKPLTDREKVFIRDHAGKPGWSYSSIAKEIARLYPADNGGYRNRQTIYTFATTDPDAPVRVQVRISKSLLDKARKAAIDIERILHEGLEDALSTREVMKVPASAEVPHTEAPKKAPGTPLKKQKSQVKAAITE